MQQRTMADLISIVLIIIVNDGEKTLPHAVLVPDFLGQKLYDRESLRYILEGKGVRSQEETSLAFHSPSVLYAKLT